jgi:hypothetical protein
MDDCLLKPLDTDKLKRVLTERLPIRTEPPADEAG